MVIFDHLSKIKPGRALTFRVVRPGSQSSLKFIKVFYLIEVRTTYAYKGRCLIRHIMYVQGSDCAFLTRSFFSRLESSEGIKGGKYFFFLLARQVIHWVNFLLSQSL